MPGLTSLPAQNYCDNHVRYSGGIECGTAVYCVEWSGTGPFFTTASLTVVYHGKPLSFSTQEGMFTAKYLLCDLCSGSGPYCKKCIYAEWSVFSSTVTYMDSLCHMTHTNQHTCVQSFILHSLRPVPSMICY